MTLEGKTEKWFKDTLDLSKVAYCIGNNTKKSKPLLVSLMTLGHRNEIFAKGVLSKLKGTKISIQEDLPEEIRNVRKKWMPTLMTLKQQGRKVQFRGDKLFCDGKVVEKKIASDEGEDPDGEDYNL